MNEKLNIQDLVDILSERRGMDKKAAETFVKEFFSLIEDALTRDRYVKIKGFGTFKLIEVDRRESVDVNTGERIEIQGHTKVSFTPDNSLKELVNKPFSHFETIVLNEGVVFDDMPSEGEDNQFDEPSAISEEVVAEQVVEEVIEAPSVIMPQEPIEEEIVETVIEETEVIVPEVSKETFAEEPEEKEIEILPIEEDVAPDLQIEEPLVEEPPTEVPSVEEESPIEEPFVEAPLVEEELIIEEPFAEESVDESPVTEEVVEDVADKQALKMDQKVENIAKRLQTEKMPFVSDNDSFDKVFASTHDSQSMKYFLAIVVIVVLLCIAAIAFLYYPDLLNKIYQQPTVEEQPKEELIEQPVQETNVADTISMMTPPVESPTEVVQEEKSEVKPEEPKETVDTKGDKNSTLVVTPAPNAATAPVRPDSVNYVIVGNHGTHVIGKGETLTKVALKYYGTKDLWPYLVKHNPDIIKNPNNVPYGTKINIPKLEKKQ